MLQVGNFTGYPLIRRTLNLKFETILMKNSVVTLFHGENLCWHFWWLSLFFIDCYASFIGLNSRLISWRTFQLPDDKMKQPFPSLLFVLLEFERFSVSSLEIGNYLWYHGLKV